MENSKNIKKLNTLNSSNDLNNSDIFNSSKTSNQRLLGEKCNVENLNPLQLAFIGDVVFEIFTREQLICNIQCSVNKLHKKAVEKVCCQNQSNCSEKLIPILTEEEFEVFRKGKNAHTKNVPKNASVAQYHNATGLEALFGYLYLKGNIERLRELFCFISPDISKSNLQKENTTSKI